MAKPEALETENETNSQGSNVLEKLADFAATTKKESSAGEVLSPPCSLSHSNSPLYEREAPVCFVLGEGDAGGHALSAHILTLERFKSVHEIQIGLQRNQSRLNHVCISQMCYKDQRGVRAITLPSQSCRNM